MAGGGTSGPSGLFAEELGLLREFVATLGGEQALLVAGDIDGLPRVLEGKSRLAARLNELAESRNRALASEGHPGNKSGMEAWLAGQPETLRNQWREILALAAEARRENEINGNLIHSRMQHNQRAIAVLQSASQQVLLYGPDGQQRPTDGGRDFGSV